MRHEKTLGDSCGIHLSRETREKNSCNSLPSGFEKSINCKFIIRFLNVAASSCNSGLIRIRGGGGNCSREFDAVRLFSTIFAS